MPNKLQQFLNLFKKPVLTKLTLDSEVVYEGEVKNNNPHGKGVLILPNGTKYEGNFAWRLFWRVPHGKGKITYPLGSEIESYEGDFWNCRIEGKGKICYRDGTHYIGKVKDGKPIHQLNDKSIPKAQSLLFCSNKVVFLGEMSIFLYTKKGILYFEDRDIYEGNFLKGKFHGEGIMYYANGDRYEGNFVEDERNGEGTYYYANGNEYKGDFLNDKRTGKGIMYFADGGKYEGDFLNGKQHGKGIIHLPNGNSLEGEFENDAIKPNSKAIFKMQNANPIEVLHDKAIKIIKLKGEDLEKLAVIKESENPDKPDKMIIAVANEFYDNGKPSITNQQSKELADNLQNRIKNTQFKNKVSFEHIDDFDKIKRSNNNKIRFISTNCPDHAFNIMVDEAEKKAVILDNGGLLNISRKKDKEKIENHLEKLGLTSEYKKIEFKDTNNFTSCVNKSQAMLEKLCRWFERGNIYKESSSKRVIPIKELLETKAKAMNQSLKTNITGEGIVKKLSKIEVSLASNMHKMHQNGVGSGVTIDISSFGLEEKEKVISISFDKNKKPITIETQKGDLISRI